MQADVPGNPDERRNQWWLIPRGQWLAIISRQTLEGFSAACTRGVALGLSAAEEPVVGGQVLAFAAELAQRLAQP